MTQLFQTASRDVVFGELGGNRGRGLFEDESRRYSVAVLLPLH